MFAAFRKANLCVIPNANGFPSVKWGQYQRDLPSLEVAENWDAEFAPQCCNYDLVCGAVSGVIALDIDCDDSSVIAKVQALAGESPVHKIGSKGYTAFYRYSGEPTKSWGGIVEILSDKHLTTIPPSTHRKTKIPYRWHADMSLIEAASTLPTLSPQFHAVMDVLYPPARKRFDDTDFPARVAPPGKYDREISIADAEGMLAFLSSDCSRDEWIRIGMALRNEFGDLARQAWHEWSSRAGEGRYHYRDAEYAWRSFTGAGIGIGSLIHAARAAGYRPESQSPQHNEEGFTVDISYLLPDASGKKKASATEVPASITVAGLVGEVSEWITTTAIRPQPALSLAAALAFMGMVKGHRVRGATNLRTNLMLLALAPTSAGKEHPQFCIDKLAEACALENHLMGRPTSGTGLLTGLKKADGISLLTIDEFGRYIGNIAMKNAGGHQKEITDYMIELFSCANRTFKGRQYADEKTNPQIILHQPHFCCLGSTVPERLQAACSSAEVIDGFLNRWIVFHTAERPEKRRGLRFGPPPPELIDRIGAWMTLNLLETDNYGNPEPKEVRFTPEAWEMLIAYDDRTVKRLDSEPFPINQLYARSAEHAEKIAMILCDGDSIGIAEMRSAIAIVEQSNLHIAAFAGKISNTQHEADLIYLLDTIKEHKTISRNRLTQKTRRLNNRTRTEILNQLLESGDITMEKSGKESIFSTA